MYIYIHNITIHYVHLGTDISITSTNIVLQVSSTMAWKRWWQGFHSANAGVWSEDWDRGLEHCDGW